MTDIDLALSGDKNLIAANLEGANLVGANLRGANLEVANLTGANLWGANLSGANLSGADLRGADLEGAYLRESNLAGADLRGVILRVAILAGADLRGADLTWANLRGADLTWANLEGAKIEWANLRGANLIGAKIDQTALDSTGLAIPTVPDLHARIASAVAAPGALDMNSWHGECETTHCRSGWAINIAGEAGYALERKLGPATAGALIYLKSTGMCPDFYASTEDALADINRCAAGEAE